MNNNQERLAKVADRDAKRASEIPVEEPDFSDLPMNLPGLSVKRINGTYSVGKPGIESADLAEEFSSTYGIGRDEAEAIVDTYSQDQVLQALNQFPDTSLAGEDETLNYMRAGEHSLTFVLTAHQNAQDNGRRVGREISELEDEVRTTLGAASEDNMLDAAESLAVTLGMSESEALTHLADQSGYRESPEESSHYYEHMAETRRSNLNLF